MQFRKLLPLALLAALASPLFSDPSECKVFPSYNLISQDASKAWHPVVGIDGNNPLILTKAGIQPSSSGWMRSNPLSMVNDQYVEFLKVIPEEDENGIKIRIQLKSSHALNGAFAVLTHRYYGNEGNSWIACKHASIPDLTGEAQTFTVWFNNKNVQDDDWNLHIFHAGKELYDVARADLKQASPKQAFNLQLFRRNTSVGKGDAKPAPFYMPVGEIDPELLPKNNKPYIVKVEVIIGKDGTISRHKFTGKVKPGIKKQISTNIEQWLFFPRIVKGKAVEQKVVIPLQLI